MPEIDDKDRADQEMSDHDAEVEWQRREDDLADIEETKREDERNEAAEEDRRAKEEAELEEEIKEARRDEEQDLDEEHERLYGPRKKEPTNTELMIDLFGSTDPGGMTDTEREFFGVD